MNPLLNSVTDTDSNLIKFANGASGANAISSAWSLHQGSYGEDGNFHGNAEDDLSEEMNNVPLHVACGYVDDVFGFFENHANPVLNMQQNPSALYLPDMEPLGMWPFTGDFHHSMAASENSMADHN